MRERLEPKRADVPRVDVHREGVVIEVGVLTARQDRTVFELLEGRAFFRFELGEVQDLPGVFRRLLRPAVQPLRKRFSQLPLLVRASSSD